MSERAKSERAKSKRGKEGKSEEQKRERAKERKSERAKERRAKEQKSQFPTLPATHGVPPPSPHNPHSIVQKGCVSLCLLTHPLSFLPTYLTHHFGFIIMVQAGEGVLPTVLICSECINESLQCTRMYPTVQCIHDVNMFNVHYTLKYVLHYLIITLICEGTKVL